MSIKTSEGKPVIKPIPCRKFKDASTPAWIEKLTEEVSEVANEAAELSYARCEKRNEVKVRKRLAEELTDVITVCVSWLDALGYDEAARGRLQRGVNEKNRRRGYHDEER